MSDNKDGKDKKPVTAPVIPPHVPHSKPEKGPELDDPKFPDPPIPKPPSKWDPKKILLTELRPDQLAVVLKNASFGIGIIINSTQGDQVGPRFSHMPAFNQPKVGSSPGCVNLDNNLMISYSEHTLNTKRAMSYAREGWTKATFGADIPFVANMKAEYTNEVGTSTAQETAQAYMFARKFLPQGDITVIEPAILQATTPFLQAVKKAIQDGNNDEEKRNNLSKVFSLWGHVVATDISVGGCITVEASYLGTRTDIADSKKNVFSAGAGAEFKSFGIKASAEHGSEVKQTAMEAANFHDIRMYGYGGDNLLQGSDAWYATVQDYRLWDNIATRSIMSTVDLLPADVKAQVMALKPDLPATTVPAVPQPSPPPPAPPVPAP